MAYIWRFSLFLYKCFSGILHVVKGNPIVKMNMKKHITFFHQNVWSFPKNVQFYHNLRMYESQVNHLHDKYQEFRNICQYKYLVILILNHCEILMHSEVMCSETSKVEKYLCYQSKQCIDSIGFFLLFPNSAWSRVHLLLPVNGTKILVINLRYLFC